MCVQKEGGEYMKLVVEIEVEDEDVEILRERFNLNSDEDVVDLFRMWLLVEVEVRVD